jgi:Protein of unknown function (DUF1573)
MNLKNKLLFCFIFVLISCQNKPSKIEFQSEYQLGNLKHGDTISTKIKIENVSDTDFLIEDIKTSCGCTIIKNNEKTIKPYDTIELEIEYIPKPEDIGLVNHSIVIKGNSIPNLSIIQLFANVK